MLLPALLFVGIVAAKVSNVTFDDTDSRITYSGDWEEPHSTPGLDYGDSHRLSMDANASASFNFTGTAIYYLSTLWPYDVTTVITVDGESSTMDLRDHSVGATNGGEASVPYAVRWGRAGLADDTHTVRLSMAQDGLYLVVDGFIYTTGDDDDDDGLSSGAVAGIVIGSILGALLLLLLLFFLCGCCRRQRREDHDADGLRRDAPFAPGMLVTSPQSHSGANLTGHHSSTSISTSHSTSSGTVPAASSSFVAMPTPMVQREPSPNMLQVPQTNVAGVGTQQKYGSGAHIDSGIVVPPPPILGPPQPGTAPHEHRHRNRQHNAAGYKAPVPIYQEPPRQNFVVMRNPLDHGMPAGIESPFKR
ncbi:hypothetical protein CYLTODRAFT_442426 [Cylindrobasidium torrendii FP15055 ss-10]|uniref:Uncharacterized protein n=1 Tax=Cylindrobasidium torrendii FP15055 ss-10 TaxID=1314674 RepID=A0A0D7BJI9_9AGAR|nr:hypothetical protein CYLTODRAFT_442426 [Cylindrobasidium torrendii FP15055 ss-10]